MRGNDSIINPYGGDFGGSDAGSQSSPTKKRPRRSAMLVLIFTIFFTVGYVSISIKASSSRQEIQINQLGADSKVSLQAPQPSPPKQKDLQDMLQGFRDDKIQQNGLIGAQKAAPSVEQVQQGDLKKQQDLQDLLQVFEGSKRPVPTQKKAQIENELALKSHLEASKQLQADTHRLFDKAISDTQRQQELSGAGQKIPGEDNNTSEHQKTEGKGSGSGNEAGEERENNMDLQGQQEVKQQNKEPFKDDDQDSEQGKEAAIALAKMGLPALAAAQGAPNWDLVEKQQEKEQDQQLETRLIQEDEDGGLGGFAAGFGEGIVLPDTAGLENGGGGTTLRGAKKEENQGLNDKEEKKGLQPMRIRNKAAEEEQGVGLPKKNEEREPQQAVEDPRGDSGPQLVGAPLDEAEINETKNDRKSLQTELKVQEEGALNQVLLENGVAEPRAAHSEEGGAGINHHAGQRAAAKEGALEARQRANLELGQHGLPVPLLNKMTAWFRPEEGLDINTSEGNKNLVRAWRDSSPTEPKYEFKPFDSHRAAQMTSQYLRTIKKAIETKTKKNNPDDPPPPEELLGVEMGPLAVEVGDFQVVQFPCGMVASEGLNLRDRSTLFLVLAPGYLERGRGVTASVAQRFFGHYPNGQLRFHEGHVSIKTYGGDLFLRQEVPLKEMHFLIASYRFNEKVEISVNGLPYGLNQDSDRSDVKFSGGLLTLGGSNGDCGFYGEIAEVLMFGSVLGDDEASTIFKYLSEKYGIDLAAGQAGGGGGGSALVRDRGTPAGGAAPGGAQEEAGAAPREAAAAPAAAAPVWKHRPDDEHDGHHVHADPGHLAPGGELDRAIREDQQALAAAEAAVSSHERKVQEMLAQRARLRREQHAGSREGEGGGAGSGDGAAGQPQPQPQPQPAARPEAQEAEERRPVAPPPKPAPAPEPAEPVVPAAGGGINVARKEQDPQALKAKTKETKERAAKQKGQFVRENVRGTVEKSGNRCTYSAGVEKWLPPDTVDLKAEYDWKNAQDEMLKKVKGFLKGGEALKNLIKSEKQKLELLRHSLFCK